MRNSGYPVATFVRSVVIGDGRIMFRLKLQELRKIRFGQLYLKSSSRVLCIIVGKGLTLELPRVKVDSKFSVVVLILKV